MQAQERRNGFRFGPARRILERGAFERALKGGTRRKLSGYVFFILPRDSGPGRLGMLVTRKHSRLAVERNRIKRRIREAFRQQQAGLSGLDILVRPPLDVRADAQMMKGLQVLFQKLGR